MKAFIHLMTLMICLVQHEPAGTLVCGAAYSIADHRSARTGLMKMIRDATWGNFPAHARALLTVM